MQIPTQIKIGGLLYDIQVVDKISHGDEEAGLIITEEQRIELKRGKPDFMQVTLLHEILHGINMEISEPEVEFLAQAIYQVIKDNQGFLQNNE